MSHWFGENIVSNDGKPVDADTISKNKLVALYFSAHWCPPCRAFTPLLADFYTKVQQTNPGDLEIIFITSDQNPEQFQDYFKTMPWKAVQFGDQSIKDVKAKFQVQSIPTLVVCKADGTVVTRDGRANVTASGQDAIKQWLA